MFPLTVTGLACSFWLQTGHHPGSSSWQWGLFRFPQAPSFHEPLFLSKSTLSTTQLLIHFQPLLFQTQPWVTSLQWLLGSLRRHMHRQPVRPALSPPQPPPRLNPGLKSVESRVPSIGTHLSFPYQLGALKRSTCLSWRTLTLVGDVAVIPRDSKRCRSMRKRGGCGRGQTAVRLGQVKFVAGNGPTQGLCFF